MIDSDLPEIFKRRESEVRSYCRSFPKVFEKAKGAFLYDRAGRRYIDFFSGAGALNYGHNNDAIKDAVLEYLKNDGIVHSLDMATTAKQRFLELFETVILAPRMLDYKVQFVGPTGTNAVEAALKLARKVKRRSNIIAFTNSYHGLSSGALAITADSFYRHEAFTSRLNVSFLPFDGYFGKDVDTIAYLRKFLGDTSSGVDLPAAIVLETIQAEGGVNVASESWLGELEMLCREFGILFVVDDIQVGCGRTGTFFSFERAGVRPDMVIISKSISGLGLPMSMLLMNAELDQWLPGEHSGTFRGNNLAFVAASEALRYWETDSFSCAIAEKSKRLASRLRQIQEQFPDLRAEIRGKGLIYGLELPDTQTATSVVGEAFKRRLIIELCGARKNVLKLLPALVIDDGSLEIGSEIIAQSIMEVRAGSQDSHGR
jgi:diaminobutyrate-2-oxoglutarate transaminase